VDCSKKLPKTQCRECANAKLPNLLTATISKGWSTSTLSLKSETERIEHTPVVVLSSDHSSGTAGLNEVSWR
jgi:hypothetical protein